MEPTDRVRLNRRGIMTSFVKYRRTRTAPAFCVAEPTAQGGHPRTLGPTPLVKGK